MNALLGIKALVSKRKSDCNRKGKHTLEVMRGWMQLSHKLISLEMSTGHLRLKLPHLLAKQRRVLHAQEIKQSRSVSKVLEPTISTRHVVFNLVESLSIFNKTKNKSTT